ncbi:MAG: hypothetical protein QM817_37055 [Archangium sp.]
MRWVFVAIIALHGAIHFLGLKRPRAPLWIAAALALLATAFAPPPFIWLVGLPALVVSQFAIATAWRDAKFGTIGNVILFLGVAFSFAAHGPLSLRAEYERAANELARAAPKRGVLTEADLAPLPEPVQRYLRLTGSVGQPHPRLTRATWKGRIRSSATDPWMELTATQLNSWDDTPGRAFFIDATLKHLPVDVFHRFIGSDATFRVRPMSAFNLINAGGEELSRAETVTILNDLCVLAPARLVDPSITLEPIDAHAARVHFKRAGRSVSAELRFDDAGWLIDFISDDRLQASADGASFKPLRWSTPLREPAAFQNRKAMRFGEARWHEPSGDFTYIELELTNLEVE